MEVPIWFSLKYSHYSGGLDEAGEWGYVRDPALASCSCEIMIEPMRPMAPPYASNENPSFQLYIYTALYILKARSQGNIHVFMFLGASFTKAKMCTRLSSTNKIGHRHPMGYNLVSRGHF